MGDRTRAYLIVGGLIIGIVAVTWILTNAQWQYVSLGTPSRGVGMAILGGLILIVALLVAAFRGRSTILRAIGNAFADIAADILYLFRRTGREIDKRARDRDH